MGTIEIQIRQAYGMQRAYPVNQEAKRLASMAGNKTLTASTLKDAEALGFEIRAVVTLLSPVAQIVTASKLAEIIE